MNSLSLVINLKVEITNTLDETILGYIYAFTPKQKVLAIRLITPSRQNSSGKSPDVFRIINTEFIKSIRVVGGKKPMDAVTSSKPDEKLNSQAKHQLKHSHGSLDRATEDFSERAPRTNGAPQKRAELSPLASKVYQRLASKLGKENIQLQGNETILLFKEVAISKPYALNKISNSKRTQNSKHLEKVRVALKEMWLSTENQKKGG